MTSWAFDCFINLEQFYFIRIINSEQKTTLQSAEVLYQGLQYRVVDKSEQPAASKVHWLLCKVSLATFIASRACTEMMFIRSKLGLNKNINLHCLSFLKT